MTENRDFKGVWIPKAVWLDERLNAIEKIILVEIDSLDSSEKGCWASNKYIADFCKCGERTVSAAISKLVKLGYLYVQSFDGRQRELKSKFTPLRGSIANIAEQPRKFCEADTQELRESNTDNNTENNTVNKESKSGKRNSFDEILSNYTQDAETLDLLGEWLKVRKAKRAAMTDRAIQMNVEKLDSCASQSGLTVKAYLKEVICRGWAAFYVIQNYSNKKRGANGIALAEETHDLDDIL